MLVLSNRNQIIIGCVLAFLMIMTRSHHFAAMHTLPGASWAVFFLAGIYLRSVSSLAGLLALAWLLDFSAYVWGDSSSNYCLTYAYVFLLPAYGSLWLAGRWFASRYEFSWRTLLPLFSSMTVGLILCELFSSGGFYFFSGRFAETTLTGFGERLIDYFPLYVESFLFYVVIAIGLHGVIKIIVDNRNLRQAVDG